MSQRRTASVTVSAVQGMEPGDVINDKSLKGFGARRQKDAVSYFLKARFHGRQRWITIGRHGNPWTPETARRRALQILADPTLADRTTPHEKTTVADTIDQFLATHGPKLKPSTLYVYRCLVRTYLVPEFGKTPVADLTRAAVAKAHARWGANPRSANHALSVLSRAMSWAEDQGFRPENSNPVHRIDRYRENSRERFLSTEEIARLGKALDDAETERLASSMAVAAIRLLILTGARLNEILTLEWRFIDLERRIAFLPDSKTGKKAVALNPAALDVLERLPRIADNPFVLPGHRHGQHLVNIQKPWSAIRRRADLDDVRIHDLRHTFASVAAASKGSLPMIGRLLGHSNTQTTARYAHLADDPLQKLNDDVGTEIAAALRGSRGAS